MKSFYKKQDLQSCNPCTSLLNITGHKRADCPGQGCCAIAARIMAVLQAQSIPSTAWDGRGKPAFFHASAGRRRDTKSSETNFCLQVFLCFRWNQFFNKSFHKIRSVGVNKANTYWFYLTLLFHFIMLLTGKNTEVLSFPSFLTWTPWTIFEIPQLFMYSQFPTLCDPHHHTVQKFKYLWQCKGRDWKIHPDKRTKVGETGIGVFGVHLIITWSTFNGYKTPSHLYSYQGQSFRSYGGQLYLAKARQ